MGVFHHTPQDPNTPHNKIKPLGRQKILGRMLLFLVPILASGAVGQIQNIENKLHQNLLENYNPLFIPKMNKSTPIEVGMETMLKKIVEYDYDKGILTSLVWLDFQWMDDYLQWDPANYGGIERVHLPPTKIWTPDIFLFNDVSGSFGEDLTRKTPWLVVESNGHVRWIPPMVLKTWTQWTWRTMLEVASGTSLKPGSQGKKLFTTVALRPTSTSPTLSDSTSSGSSSLHSRARAGVSNRRINKSETNRKRLYNNRYRANTWNNNIRYL